MEPNNNNINPLMVKKGLRNGLLAALYIIAIAMLMFYLPRSFDNHPNVVIVIFGLLTFVISALVTGTLVLWVPAKLLVQGQVKDAGGLLCVTGATLVVALALTTVALFLIK
jgi:hypothetical protein